MNATVRNHEQILSAHAQPQREHVRALLIDDDLVDAHLIRQLLSRSKHLDVALTICRTVEEASSLLGRNRYDVLFVDYWLGMQTSISFIHDFSRAYDVPSILLTSLDEPDIRRIGFRAGVEAFLSKDEISTPALEAVTLAVLRHHATL